MVKKNRNLQPWDYHEPISFPPTELDEPFNVLANESNYAANDEVIKLMNDGIRFWLVDRVSMSDELLVWWADNIARFYGFDKMDGYRNHINYTRDGFPETVIFDKIHKRYAIGEES